MTDVTMMGLGAMGSALAGTLLKAGHGVTVWNRSSSRLAPLVAEGAQGAATVAEAVAASPVVMVCIDNYDATNAHLGAPEVRPLLKGRTIVQLSTGAPKEARDAEAFYNGLGAAYIDGAIEEYPAGIGTPDAHLIYCGAEAAYRQLAPLLRCFGGEPHYLGDNIAAAAALDLAKLSLSLGKYVGFAHGARLCAAEGVGADQLAQMFHGDPRAREMAEIVHAQAYELSSLYPGASIRVWEGVIQRLQSQADAAGMSREFPDNISRLSQRAIKAGLGEEDLAALAKAVS